MILFGNNSFSQSNNHFVLSPINFLYNSTTSIDLIASETVNTSNYSSESIITQGFLQPESYIFLNVEDQNESFFRFYPNPVQDGIFIEFKRNCGNQMKVTLFNYLGKKIKEINLFIDFQNKLYLNLNGLQNGVYLISMYDIEKGSTSTLKLIKQ
jgi:hypothetical protein